MLTQQQPSEGISPTPTPTSTFTISTLSQDKVTATFFAWARSEQWNPTAQGADLGEVYFPLDSSAFIGGSIVDPATGESKIISIVSGVRYGAEQAWVGFYIVDPAERGHGYGLKTFKHVLQNLDDSTRASIGLDGVMAQVANYRKSGFTNVGWQNERRHGDLVKLINFQERNLADQIRAGTVAGFKDLADVEEAQLVALETRYSGLKRPEFVHRWVQFHSAASAEARDRSHQHRFSTAVVAQDGKTVLGYGCIRPAQSSYRIGPIYASTVEIAKQILVKLAVDVVAGEERQPLGVPLEVDIDVPNTNKLGGELFDRLGWLDTFPSLRMWKGPVPEHDANGVFGVATLEIG
ncbi:MAG: hypothetical protein BYD32DRAFT_405147 [Podila humilis]|nr:MAG: hypothetical protein BYD32DRAFT_405147 [Podila humilis]